MIPIPRSAMDSKKRKTVPLQTTGEQFGNRLVGYEKELSHTNILAKKHVSSALSSALNLRKG